MRLGPEARGRRLCLSDEPAALCGSGLATNRETLLLVTNSSEWYPLAGENDLGYSFAVNFADRGYDFTASTAPVSITCATRYIPSGRTSISTDGF